MRCALWGRLESSLEGFDNSTQAQIRIFDHLVSLKQKWKVLGRAHRPELGLGLLSLRSILRSLCPG